MFKCRSKLFIKTEGNSSIGFGHIMRSKAFAAMVASQFDVTIFLQNTPFKLFQELKKENLQIKSLENNKEFLDQLKGDEIVVLDLYRHDELLQKSIKEKNNKLVCINDTPEGVFFCDLIINHAPGVLEEQFEVGWDRTQFALGPEYSLLRPSFLEIARQNIKKKKDDSIFICFGGSDPLNLTEKVLKQLIKIGIKKKIAVVTGSGYNKLETLAKYSGNGNIFLYHNISEKKILSLMRASYYAIVPASTILYEVLAAGCIPITTYYVNNQKRIFEGFNRIGSILPFKKVEELNNSIFNNSGLSITNRVIDGNSPKRIVNILLKFK